MRSKFISGEALKDFLFAILVIVLAPGCATRPALKPDFDSTPRVAIISAFAPELEKLLKTTEVQQVQVINGRKHYVGQLEGQDVVLVLSGYSMVNASMNTQSLLDHYKIKEIVFSGIAGGVNPNLNIGDVTVPAQWGQYQEQAFVRETTNGWAPGRFKESFTNYGMMFPRNVLVTRKDSTPDKEESRFWFQADPRSLQIATGLTNTVKLSRCTEKGDCLEAAPRLVIGGNGVSGQTFVDNASYRQWIWDTFHADAVDMETAAVATVAHVNQVPFIAFRSLSDLAGGGKGENEMETFFKLAADNSATVVLAYLKALGHTNSYPQSVTPKPLLFKKPQNAPLL